MKTKLLAGMIGAAMMLAPLGFAQDDQKPSPTSQERSADKRPSGMSDDMRRAVEWERAKDRAAERQARLDARSGGGTERSADRVMDDKDPGRKVKDTKAPGYRKTDKK